MTRLESVFSWREGKGAAAFCPQSITVLTLPASARPQSASPTELVSACVRFQACANTSRRVYPDCMWLGMALRRRASLLTAATLQYRQSEDGVMMGSSKLSKASKGSRRLGRVWAGCGHVSCYLLAELLLCAQNNQAAKCVEVVHSKPLQKCRANVLPGETPQERAEGHVAHLFSRM